MAKRKAVSNVVISKKELLLPKMEFLPLDEAGQGFFVKAIGGAAFLEFREFIKKLEKEAGGGDLSFSQEIELMTDLVYRTACNSDGTAYFASRDETKLFADSSFLGLQLAFDKAQEMAGMGANKNLKNGLNSSSMDS